MTNIAKKIETVREQIAALESQLADPAHVHMSRAELRDVLVSQIDEWHDRATARIADDLAALAAGDFANLLVTPTEDRGYEEDVRAFMTFAIGKDAMLNRFEPLLADMPEGIDAARRAQHLAGIKAELVKLELREDELLREADAQGIAWLPRPGQRAEPAVLIGYGK
ncbi:hypothetical protein WKW77_10055 [Variovorax ureilyticus]|uniref:Uncharacterized protein n=1 Tax=Variovorax ureilyticus TaxID=1836198 RepID=A0ABU8VCY0_9BURK